MSFRKIFILSMALSSVSAIAGDIQFLGANEHLPAAVCGCATNLSIDNKQALKDLNDSVEKVRKPLMLSDADIEITGLSYAVVTTKFDSTQTCVCALVKPRTERAARATMKDPGAERYSE